MTPSTDLSLGVQEYYGATLGSSADLRTNACCDASSVPVALRPLLARIHPEVLSRYYGCGLVVPPLLEGLRVLDLGCGSGRDVYLLAQLVGAGGQVVGVDMTPEQLAVARRHQPHHAERFGFANVQFLEGRIEQLEQLPLEPGSFDLVISNCVVNLSTDKLAVLKGCGACSSAVVSSSSPMSMPTGVCPRRFATIRCSTANASAAPSTGTISCAWPAGPASPIPAW